MRIIVERTIPYIQGIEIKNAELVFIDAKDFTPNKIRNADALVVRSINSCNQQLLEGSKVRLISSATIGFDHIDTDFCANNNIEWKNAPGSNATSVAQYVINAILSVSTSSNISLIDKTIGIVGVGHVGKQVERLSRLLGMKTLLNDPPRAEKEGGKGFVSLEEIAEKSDIITLHTPLTNHGKYATRHLANEEFFDKVRLRPIFINAARGAITETEALLQAKKAGKLGHLIIDCWENEPNISAELLKNATIATPHIAGFSAEGKANATRMSLENVEKHLGICVKNIDKITAPIPMVSTIDITHLKKPRINHAISRYFSTNLSLLSSELLTTNFEETRNKYQFHHEYSAYSLHGASESELLLWENIVSLSVNKNQKTKINI